MELLVAIGIMALLLASLFPALGNARHAAASVQCLSNLRQIGIGIRMYADDNSGWLIARYTDGAQFPDWAEAIHFKYFNSQGATAKFTDFERPPGIWACPESQAVVNRWHPVTTHYGWNVLCCPNTTNTTYPPFKLNKVRRPSEAVCATDSVDTVAAGPPDRVGTIQCAALITPYRVDPIAPGNISFRHGNKKANALYMDGHAATISLQEGVVWTLDQERSPLHPFYPER